MATRGLARRRPLVIQLGETRSPSQRVQADQTRSWDVRLGSISARIDCVGRPGNPVLARPKLRLRQHWQRAQVWVTVFHLPKRQDTAQRPARPSLRLHIRGRGYFGAMPRVERSIGCQILDGRLGWLVLGGRSLPG